MTKTLQEIADQGQALLDTRANAPDWDIAEYGDGRVEGGVSAGNKAAWHGLLTLRPEELLSMETAFNAYPPAGYRVDIEPIYTKDGIEIPNRFVTIREDRRPLGIVGTKYKTFQNRSVTEMGDAILDAGHRIETMVVTRSGARFFVVFRLDTDMQIAGLEAETLRLYLMLSTSHDGSSPLRADITPVRAECENSQNFAIKTAPRSYVLRHTASMEGRVLEIQKALGMSYKYTEALQEISTKLIKTPMRGSDFSAYLNKLVPLPEDEKSRGYTMRMNAQGKIRALYTGAPNLEHCRDTRWAALQAVSEYSDHHMGSRETVMATSDENRFERIVEGAKNSLPNRAFALLT